MIPREKARQLMKKHLKSYNDEQIAIKSALITVDEIIKSKKINYLFTQEEINSMEFTSDNRWIDERFIKYWKKVKKEILVYEFVNY
jgi:hypothetical protein